MVVKLHSRVKHDLAVAASLPALLGVELPALLGVEPLEVVGLEFGVEISNAVLLGAVKMQWHELHGDSRVELVGLVGVQLSCEAVLEEELELVESVAEMVMQ